MLCKSTLRNNIAIKKKATAIITQMRLTESWQLNNIETQAHTSVQG